MSLTFGIVGLPLSGKTTIFNLLTHSLADTSKYFSGKTESNLATAFVPDSRIDYLSRYYQPKKTVYAQIECTDVAGLVRGSSEGKGVGNSFLSTIRDVDGLVFVIRVFDDSTIEHSDGSIDPMRDWETIEMELLIADLEAVERNIAKITSGKKITKENAIILSALEKCLIALSDGKSVHTVGLTEEERYLLRGFSFFTDKPYMIVINQDEGELNGPVAKGVSDVLKKAEKQSIPVVNLCAKVEAEIDTLDDSDKQVFLEEMGIDEPGINKLAQAAYQLLGLISFFTVGEDEVKAWTIKKGTNAKQAAGKIHSDIEKGFIRAEVFHFDMLKQWGSPVKVKEQGGFRLEGKEYIVQDGDIINFRFNV
jgi:GTP-binding protein YchF